MMGHVQFPMLMVSQFVRYAIVGVMNTALDYAILNFLSISFGVYAGTPIILFNSISATIVIIHSYIWNKYWTFASVVGMRIEFPKFIAVNAGAFVLNTAIVYSLTTFVSAPLGFGPLVWENIAKTAALAVNVIWNFLGFKFFVFRSSGMPQPGSL